MTIPAVLAELPVAPDSTLPGTIAQDPPEISGDTPNVPVGERVTRLLEADEGTALRVDEAHDTARAFSLTAAIPLVEGEFPPGHEVHGLYEAADRAAGTSGWLPAAEAALKVRFGEANAALVERLLRRLEMQQGTTLIRTGTGMQTELCGRIGGGGMGLVHEVWVPNHGQLAMKTANVEVLPTFDVEGHWQARDNPSLAERFHREARALAVLSAKYPHCSPAPTLYKRDTVHMGSDGSCRPAIFMEYCDGWTFEIFLDNVMRSRQKPLTFTEALDIVALACEGLMRAHAAEVVNRDVKPPNLMLLRDGRVKVLDFGICKFMREDDPFQSQWTQDRVATADRTILGTLQFITPEQAAGHPVDDKTDVHALVQTLYNLLTNRFIHGSHVGMDCLREAVERPDEAIAALTKDLPRTLQGRALSQALTDALAVQRGDRVSAQQLLEAMLPFTSYGEMAADDFSRDVRQGTIRAPESVLKLAAESDVSLADVLKRSPTPVKDGRRWVRWAIDAAIVVVATGVIVTGISLFPRGSEEKRRAYDSVAESPLASGKPAIEASPPPKPSGTKPPTSVEGGSPARGPDFVVSSLEGGSQKATLFQGLPSELSLDPARLSLFYRDGESGQQFVGARYCFSSEELARMLGCTPASLENVPKKLWIWPSSDPRGIMIDMEGKLILCQSMDEHGAVTGRRMYADQTAGVKLPEQLERAGYRSGDNLVDDPVLKGALGSARPVTTSQDDGDPGRDFDKFTTFMRDALLPPK